MTQNPVLSNNNEALEIMPRNSLYSHPTDSIVIDNGWWEFTFGKSVLF